jgi:YbbR domain-containing protein
MKGKQIIEKIQENWPAKIVCFVMALFLYVFYQVATLDRKSFSIPLTISARGGMLPASGYPSHVRITVRGRPEDLAAVKEDDLSAYLDLNTCVKEGPVTVPVLINLSQKVLLFDPFEIHVSPESVSLTVEQQISGYAPVTPLLSGEPAHGYITGKVIVEPDKVRITGPRSMVENCTRLQTSPVAVDGAQSIFYQKAAVENAGAFIQLSDIHEVSVMVDVLPASLNKTFTGMPVTFVHLSDNLEVDGTMPGVDLTLSGNMLDLEKYIPGPFVILADCSKVDGPGTYEIPLTAAVPDAFKVDDKTARSVTVVFKYKGHDEKKVSLLDPCPEQDKLS